MSIKFVHYLIFILFLLNLFLLHTNIVISTPIVGQFSGYIKVDSSVVLGSGFSGARPRSKYTSNGV